MTETERFKRDATTISNVMNRYTGEEGCHFGFIAKEDGKRQYFTGGNVAIAGYCLSEALATLVQSTPGLDEEFIHVVAKTATDMLKDEEGPVQ